MGAAETLASFFQAENDRDWETYRTFLHADVVWHLHAEHERVIQGIEEYLRVMQDAYRDSNTRFRVEEMHESARGERIAVLLIDDDGARSFEVFDFEDGRIRGEHEFLLG
ncbi:nuclear transport factor 2 family protein [Olsenella sp. Marseille-P4559]|uniref:nuclear transport factor 2 family protein n=1 Tax=Olsenella sp. Marseille-P4559 TaxID=2364795 RepID=UPI0010326585|nr:nuclear transport factor 2 family protein [Olsenella sp. Marseille-P4559]